MEEKSRNFPAKNVIFNLVFGNLHFLLINRQILSTTLLYTTWRQSQEPTHRADHYEKYN
jgi:hypothetical protein